MLWQIVVVFIEKTFALLTFDLSVSPVKKCKINSMLKINDKLKREN